MDILLLIYFSFVLHKLAASKGENPLTWVLRYMSSWFAINFLIALYIFSKYGEAIIENPIIWQITPVMLILNILIFGYFRALLMRKPNAETDISNHTEEQQDLSYFR